MPSASTGHSDASSLRRDRHAPPAMTAHLTLVVAIDRDNGIGIDNQMPWHLPHDLAHFKRVTLGKPVNMGRKTFDSIGRPLPGRRNIVISRGDALSHDAEWVNSLDAALTLVSAETEVMVIGGAEVYRQALPLASGPTRPKRRW